MKWPWGGMVAGVQAAGVIPALNEQATVGQAVTELRDAGVDPVVVADNGSTDGTADRARSAGAVVVTEPQRGYGAACLAALHVLAGNPPDAVVFMDADLSDLPQEAAALLGPLQAGYADMVIGSRVLGMARGMAAPGCLTVPQRVGNALTCRLLALLYGAHATDLGPFRAIRWDALMALGMADRDFGWTVEMQVKAAQRGLRVQEVPVSYRVRTAGTSKVSGNVVGSVKAGVKILYTVARNLGTETT